MARLKEHYRKNVLPALQAKFGYKNVMQVPRITKITLNMGVGEAMADKKVIDNAANDMMLISGQKPQITARAQVDRQFQGARELAGGLQGHAARRAHVRISRPPHQCRDSAHPRFPRPAVAFVRRARQLFARHQGTDYFPRDRFRQGPVCRVSVTSGADGAECALMMRGAEQRLE